MDASDTREEDKSTSIHVATCAVRGGVETGLAVGVADEADLVGRIGELAIRAGSIAGGCPEN